MVWRLSISPLVSSSLSVFFMALYLPSAPTTINFQRDEKLSHAHCELNYHDQKIRRTPMHDIGKHWIIVSILLGLISSVYLDLRHWRSNQWPQTAGPKLYNWANSPYRTQVTPNQLVMVIARPINLNSCPVFPYVVRRCSVDFLVWVIQFTI